MSAATLEPMLARLVRELPGVGHAYEPKWDGFRCLAERDGDAVELVSRHGRPLARYFPELVEPLAALPPDRWLIDGEILVTDGERFDFEALMLRLHPAVSRVRELAQRTPAVFVAFDLPRLGDRDLVTEPFRDRRRALEQMLAAARPPLFLTPTTTDRAVAERWLHELTGNGLDGVVAKPLDSRYEAGRRAMLKVKRERTADCVLAGVRASAEPLEVLALMLGLYDRDGALRFVGVASSFKRVERAALAHELAPLVSDLAGHPWEHGFGADGGSTGRLRGAANRWLPGMPMDWVPMRPERVCEVRYSQVDGHRLRQPARLVRWRPDRTPESCKVEQLEVSAPPARQVLGAA